MKTVKYHYFLLFIIFLFLNTIPAKGQLCGEWLYQDLESDDYVIEDDIIVLFYCSDDIEATIQAPTASAEWYYNYMSSGEITECLSIGSTFQPLGTNPNCPINADEKLLTVDFVGKDLDGNIVETCTFKMLFFEAANPEIVISDNNKTYNSDEKIIVCEEAMTDNMVTLTATGLGSNPSTFEYTEYQWYLGPDIIEGANSISLDLSTIDYSINDPSLNKLSFSILNFCTDNTVTRSPERSIQIYEGYGDECDPCKWYFPDNEANQFYAFSPNEDGIADYFPEAPNNEINRIAGIQDKLSQPTCEATIYRVSIYNRIGREVFISQYDNHPWDGKLSNGRKCQDGTYFYKIEYKLNPHNPIPDNQQNKTQLSIGTVYLESGN